MIRDLYGIARQVAMDFLQTNPKPQSSFWSIRDIAKRYNCSEYAAYSIIKVLGEHGYLEQTRYRRSYLNEHVDLSLLGNSMGSLRPAFIWPHWKTEESGNLAVEFSREVERLCNAAYIPHLFLESPDMWGDASLSLKLKAISANAVMAIDPPPRSLILFTKLRAEKIPILSLGAPRDGYEELGVVTIEGDEREAHRLLKLKLMALGLKTVIMVGRERPQIAKTALLRATSIDLIDIEKVSSFLDETGLVSQIHQIKKQLRMKNPPDALIFNDAASLELTLELLPDFSKGARERRYHVILYDNTGLHARIGDRFPVITVTHLAHRLAGKSIEILQSMRNGARVSRRTLVPMRVHWPDAVPALSY